MSTFPYRYTAYGLRIGSEVCVPWLLDAPGQDAPDVSVRFGPLPSLSPGSSLSTNRAGGWAAEPGSLRLHVDGVAHYLVTRGHDIRIERQGGSEPEIAVFLCGSVLAALLQQRGVLPLHASAVRIGEGAVLFLGRSGAGKSSLAAALIARGYRMLTDDVAGIVDAAARRPAALPAFPCLHLWADAGYVLRVQDRMREAVQAEMGKYRVTVPIGRFTSGRASLRAAYVLGSHNRDSVEIRRLRSREAFPALVRHVYRRRFLKGLGLWPGCFHALARLAECVPVRLVTRPFHPFRPDELADRIDRDLAAPVAHGTHE